MQGSKLYVGNLKYSVTNDQLSEIFSAHGEVKSVNIIEGKGFGFVEMSTPEEAGKAKDALNDTDFDGRPLKIDEAKPSSIFNGRPSKSVSFNASLAFPASSGVDISTNPKPLPSMILTLLTSP